MYSFLQNLTLKDTTRKRVPTTRHPEGLALRIFSTGEVYPSKELTDKFDLEYKTKSSENRGNGFDVFDSTEWTPTAELPRMILVAAVPKSEAKVTLFGTCRFDSEGNPLSSVQTQGSVCKELLSLVRSMGYLTDEQKYCDLQVVIDYPIKTEDGIAYIPKTIERGAEAGNKTNERRENLTIYPLNTTENLEEMRKATTSPQEVQQTSKV